MRKRWNQLFGLPLLGAFMLCLAPALAGAQEVIGTSYTPDELAKVKDWEITWVGK
jgi:hypothetical protein